MEWSDLPRDMPQCLRVLPPGLGVVPRPGRAALSLGLLPAPRRPPSQDLLSTSETMRVLPVHSVLVQGHLQGAPNLLQLDVRGVYPVHVLLLLL